MPYEAIVDGKRRELGDKRYSRGVPPSSKLRCDPPLEGPCVPELRRELSRGNGEQLGPPELIPLCRTEAQLEAVSGFGAGSEVELDWMEMVGLARAVQRAREAGLRVTLATVRVQKPGEETYDRRVRRFRVELVWEGAEEVTRTLMAYRKLLAGELSSAAALKAASVHERYGVTTPLRIHKR